MGCSDKNFYGGNKNCHHGNGDIPQPGPCPVDPYTGKPECPPPTELVCIKVDKVYESCKDLHVNEEVVDLAGIAAGTILEVECLDPELVIDDDHPFCCEKIAGTSRIKTSFYYRYRFRWVDEAGTHIYVSDPVYVQRVAIMSDLARDPRIQPQCELFLTCLECFVSNLTEVTCCIGKMILFKLTAHVQLLVPAYGFCPEPPDCPEVQDECTEFLIPPEEWPPHYPPQPGRVNNLNG